MVNESLVTRARNNLMAKMMTNPSATHFMFIDADIRFQPESILQMMACDKDVIGGLYPKKALPVNYVINLKRETRSIPTVSCFFRSIARRNLVPTPSVPETRIGSR